MRSVIHQKLIDMPKILFKKLSEMLLDVMYVYVRKKFLLEYKKKL